MRNNPVITKPIGHIVIMGLAALLLTTACDKKKASGGTPTAGSKTAVATAIAKPSAIARNIIAIGTIRHAQETAIGFTSAGEVTAMRFEPGDFIRQGALVASLSTETAVTVAGGSQSTATDTESAAAYARLAKMEGLYRDGWVTKKQYESAVARADATRAQAQAPVTVIKRGSSSVYAAASGVVLAKLAEAGQMVGPGSPAYIVGQDSLGFIFRAPIAAEDAAKLKAGMTANITVEAVTTTPLEASISKIEEQSGKAGSPVMVQFRMPPAKGIKSAQIGTASIQLSSADDGYLEIPASALFGISDKSASVYVIAPGTRRAELRSVMVGQMAGSLAIVKGGVLPGDTVVISGTERVKPGMQVTAKR
jgi:RND family efflux transporter MFP subunit